MTATDPFVPNGRVRAAVFALALIGLAVMAWELPSPAGAFSLYPPLLALVLAPLTRLPEEHALLLWQLVNVAMLYGVYVEWRRIYRSMRTAPAPGWLVLTTVIAIGIPLVLALQGAQVTVLVLYTTLLGFAFALCGDDPAEWWAAGIVLAIPAAIHLTPAIAGVAVVLMFLARDRRRGAMLGLSFLTGLALWLFVVPSIVLGWQRNYQLLTAFTAGLTTRWTATLATACAIAILLASRRLLRGGSALELTVVFGLACAVALFSTPAASVTLAFPFIAAAPVLLLDRGRPAAARLLALACAAAVVAQLFITAPLLTPALALCVLAFCAAFVGSDPSPERWRPRRQGV